MWSSQEPGQLLSQYHQTNSPLTEVSSVHLIPNQCRIMCGPEGGAWGAGPLKDVVAPRNI